MAPEGRLSSAVYSIGQSIKSPERPCLRAFNSWGAISP